MSSTDFALEFEKFNQKISANLRQSTFLNSFHQQSFPFRSFLMNYISKNPTSSKCYQKLIQTCKFFFIQDPILVVPRLLFVYEKRKWNTYFNGKRVPDLHKILPMLWITEDIDYVGERILPANYLSSIIIPKLYKCDAKKLNLFDQNLGFEELKFLASKCESINLGAGPEKRKDSFLGVKNEDGSVVSLQKIFEALPNVKVFEYRFYDPSPAGLITPNTIKELIAIPQFLKLDKFQLKNIPESFDVDTFCSYIKMNKKTKIWLEFSNQISVAYKGNVQTIVNEIVSTKKCNFKIPYISFSGIDSLSYRKLVEFYISQEK